MRGTTMNVTFAVTCKNYECPKPRISKYHSLETAVQEFRPIVYHMPDDVGKKIINITGFPRP